MTRTTKNRDHGARPRPLGCLYGCPLDHHEPPCPMAHIDGPGRCDCWCCSPPTAEPDQFGNLRCLLHGTFAATCRACYRNGNPWAGAA